MVKVDDPSGLRVPSHLLFVFAEGNPLRIGLVEEVCATGGAKAKALELAKKVENQSPSSVRICKELIQAGRSKPISQVLPYERELFVDLFSTQDQAEGVAAFLEKRKPNWKNV